MMTSNRVPTTLAALLLTTSAAFAQAAQATASPRHAGGRWGADYFPNVRLVTHEGESVRFFDDLIKDKVVAINFIYTSCPDSCPLETARMLEVQNILGERVGTDVFLYSITIDPAVDTPEVLNDFAERYQVKPGWKFLTGDEDDITLLRQKLGLYIDEIQDGSNDHNLSLIIGNQATGVWMKRSPFENPYVLATQIGGWLHNWQPVDPDADGYENAPELRSISKGEMLFRTRCTSCHVVGQGDGLPRVGPNLRGVLERRERAWLERWIRAPDEVLAAGDPIATALFESYNRVPMPNMRLGKIEVDYLLEYLSRENRRLDKLQEELELAPPADEAAGGCCMKNTGVVLSEVDGVPATAGAEAALTEAPPTNALRGALLLLGCMGLVIGAVAAKVR